MKATEPYFAVVLFIMLFSVHFKGSSCSPLASFLFTFAFPLAISEPRLVSVVQYAIDLH